MTQIDSAGGDTRDDPETSGAQAPKLKKSDRRRAEIVRHAQRLFETKGFHNTTLDDIAKEVGIRREGIYYYFKNPTDILLSIVRPNIERLNARVGLIVAADLHPASKFYLAIDTHLRLFDRTSLDTIGLGARGKYPDSIGFVHKDMTPLYRKYQDLWVEIIRQGREQGVFAATGAPKIMVFAILGMCNWMGHWYDPAKPASLDDIAETFFAVAACGVMTRGGDTAGPGLTAARRAETLDFQRRHGAP